MKFNSPGSTLGRYNLDWFNYWLLGERDPDPAKAEQYARWDAMAAIWLKKQAAAAAPDTAPGTK